MQPYQPNSARHLATPFNAHRLTRYQLHQAYQTEIAKR